MGTTRIKVIDLSGEQEQIKTSRKHAEKLAGVAKLKETKKAKEEAPKQKQPTGDVSKPQEAQVVRETPVTKVPKQPAPTEKKRHLGKKYRQAAKLIEKDKAYSARQAIDLLSQTSITRFDPTVEIHLNVTDKNIRGSLALPHPPSSRKKKKILVFGGDQKITRGDVILGNETTIEEIAQGKLKPNRDFDKVIATSKFMPQLAKVAKILGPAQMMPNPKEGTVVEDVATALQKGKESTSEYKTDPTAPIVHTIIGKLSNKPEQLEQNLKALIGAIGPTKIKKATITTTMGPGIKVDISTIAQ